VYKGFKLFHGAAAEARSLAGIMIYLARFADPVAMAHLLGIEEPDPYEALMYVLDAVREGTKVMIVGAAPCYLHLAGVPGFPQLIARMQPSYIVRHIAFFVLFSISTVNKPPSLAFALFCWRNRPPPIDHLDFFLTRTPQGAPDA